MKKLVLLACLPLLALSGDARSESGIASVFCDRVIAWAHHRMDCNGMQAAHLTLPLGSRIRVCGPKACGVVTIVDRGPYVRGRVLDLAPGAARVLGVNGLGHVSF